jgi:raffinose/stachyose/melibiose transport system permease protein
VTTGDLVSRKPRRNHLLSVVAILASLVVFVIPFLFILLTAVKNRQE